MSRCGDCLSFGPDAGTVAAPLGTCQLKADAGEQRCWVSADDDGPCNAFAPVGAYGAGCASPVQAPRRRRAGSDAAKPQAAGGTLAPRDAARGDRHYLSARGAAGSPRDEEGDA